MPSLRALPLLLAAALPMGMPNLHGATEVKTGHDPSDAGFRLGTLQPPALNDAAARAKFTVVDGRGDSAGADVAALSDGKIPGGDDEPRANFFFAQGTDGGRIVGDLGEVMPVKSVASYSWHRGGRGPQFYRLFAASGTEAKFDASPERPTRPEDHGWTAIATIDTRMAESPGGGQHAAEITAGPDEPLGSYRYFLFDIQPAAAGDPYGNTFFSEIDIISAKDPEPERIKTPVRIVNEFPSADGRFRYIVDSTRAPELTGWSGKELLPVIREWYPKLVALLPGEGYRAPDVVTFTYQPGIKVPAYALGNKITLNPQWFAGELEREAKGCVVHEMGHVVQNYWRARMTHPSPKETPGWVTEGICDYLRWFLYEPESKGAGIGPGRLADARYDKSYRITANFMDWVITSRDPDLLRKLNTAARQGNYEEGLWKSWTGKTLQELDGEWKEAISQGRRIQK